LSRERLARPFTLPALLWAPDALEPIAPSRKNYRYPHPAPNRSFDLLDQWLSAIEADTSSLPHAKKVTRNRPAAARDACFVVDAPHYGFCIIGHLRSGSCRVLGAVGTAYRPAGSAR
jgi:uncharacterized tannase-like protein DUF6351